MKRNLFKKYITNVEVIFNLIPLCLILFFNFFIEINEVLLFLGSLNLLSLILSLEKHYNNEIKL